MSIGHQSPRTSAGSRTETVAVTLSTNIRQGPFSQLTIRPAARVGGKLLPFDGTVIDDLGGAAVEASIRIADYGCLDGTVDVLVTTQLVVGNDTVSGEVCYKRLNDGDLFWPASFGGLCF